jgi:hypothetical protein
MYAKLHLESKCTSNFNLQFEYSFKLLLFFIVVPDYFTSQLPNLQTGCVVGPIFFTLTWRKREGR